MADPLVPQHRFDKAPPAGWHGHALPLRDHVVRTAALLAAVPPSHRDRSKPRTGRYCALATRRKPPPRRAGCGKRPARPPFRFFFCEAPSGRMKSIVQSPRPGLEKKKKKGRVGVRRLPRARAAGLQISGTPSGCQAEERPACFVHRSSVH
jgi:hypothetical protein